MSKYINVPEKFVPPQRRVYQDIGNLHYYLLDENCFDQFVVIHNPRNTGEVFQGNKTSIYLNSMPEPSLVDERAVSIFLMFILALIIWFNWRHM